MNVIPFDNLPSTNAYAQENLKSLKHKDVILAFTQSQGKGRMQRVWISPRGGLYFSVVLKPSQYNTAVLSSLTQAMALAVCKTLNAKGLNTYLKWPNDVLCQGKKICGILSNAVFEDNTLTGIIVGAGINVSQENLHCDKPAVTLKQLGLEIENETLLNLVLNSFDTLQEQVLMQGFTAIKQDFKANFPYLNTQVNICVQGKNIQGVAVDLDEEGRLILQTQNGTQAVTMGDMDF